IILISFAQSATELFDFLFGNVLAVREIDLLLTPLVSGIVLIFVFFFYKELKITSFDPTMAKAYGLNTSLIHYLLMFFLTLVGEVSLQTVGTISVFA
ncbi:iron chelate uptake ABC transporter family permease subunit, partial [Enterococcus lactis]|uniref:iron chelate uptake ABC transporter family permease subunit n=1 Tax=Enterococcus lactis TaxID=357441 RepID=UPI0031CD4506